MTGGQAVAPTVDIADSCKAQRNNHFGVHPTSMNRFKGEHAAPLLQWCGICVSRSGCAWVTAPSCAHLMLLCCLCCNQTWPVALPSIEMVSLALRLALRRLIRLETRRWRCVRANIENSAIAPVWWCAHYQPLRPLRATRLAGICSYVPCTLVSCCIMTPIRMRLQVVIPPEYMSKDNKRVRRPEQIP